MNVYWHIPSKENADFIAYMKDILDVYEKYTRCWAAIWSRCKV